MKSKILYPIIFLFLMLSWGCKKEPTTAEILVNCTPLAGQTVDVSDLNAELHASATYENLKYKFAVKGSASASTGTIKDLVPGRYFLVVWKDLDNSLNFTKNDFFGFYPQALDLKAGDKLTLPVQMYVVE